MQALEGYEHLGQDFWDHVEPDEESSCLIFRSNVFHPNYGGTTIMAYVAGHGRLKHRTCERRLCVHPDHIREGRNDSAESRDNYRAVPRKVRSQRQFNRWFSQC